MDVTAPPQSPSAASPRTTAPKYNPKSPGVKRILNEWKELSQRPSRDFVASPMEDNLYEWHFTIRGPPDTDFDGGLYHGRILLPAEYPFKPPNIILLTPNGRFEVGKKICLSITGYHPEYWQPAWGSIQQPLPICGSCAYHGTNTCIVRTALMALISFFPTQAEGAIGGIDWKPEERKVLARSSVDWKCSHCEGTNQELMLQYEPEPAEPTQPEATETSVPPTTTSDVDLSMFRFNYRKSENASQEGSAGALASSAAPSPETNTLFAQPPTALNNNSPSRSRHVSFSSSSSPLQTQAVHRRPTRQDSSSSSLSGSTTFASPSAATNRATAAAAPPPPRRSLDVLFVLICFALCMLVLGRLLRWLGPAYNYMGRE